MGRPRSDLFKARDKKIIGRYFIPVLQTNNTPTRASTLRNDRAFFNDVKINKHGLEEQAGALCLEERASTRLEKLACYFLAVFVTRRLMVDSESRFDKPQGRSSVIFMRYKRKWSLLMKEGKAWLPSWQVLQLKKKTICCYSLNCWAYCENKFVRYFERMKKNPMFYIYVNL